jgi:hypothetical protein
MDAKYLLAPTESPSAAPADPGVGIVLLHVVRIPRGGFPVADSAEEVRRIPETVDPFRSFGERQEGTR